MQVVAGGVARRADVGDLLPLLDLLPDRYVERAVVPVEGAGAVGVLDDDALAVLPVPAREHDAPLRRRVDGRAVRGGEVDAVVVGIVVKIRRQPPGLERADEGGHPAAAVGGFASQHPGAPLDHLVDGAGGVGRLDRQHLDRPVALENDL